MADVVRTPLKQRLQMAAAIVGTLFTLNTIFWVASSFYYDDKPLEAAHLDNVRFAFGLLTMIVAGAAYAAALAPRLLGHGLAGLMSVSSIVGGIAAMSKGLPPVLGATMLVVGVVTLPLIWKSLHHSRAAWSFLIAIVLVFGTVDFFGAPKISNLLGIGLWNALIFPGLKIVCVIALAMLRDEYRD